ncbi:MAG: hypothetical protein ACRD3G_24845 [Vicinamibacterales bacterium]
MTRLLEKSTALRFAVGAVMAGGMSSGLVKATNDCAEVCDGDCWIMTWCDTCDAGDPHDCIIFWDSGDQACYDHFACHYSCPDCWVS